MKHTNKHQLSFFFIPALCITYTKILSMEKNILYKPLLNKQLVNEYRPPFPKEYKQKLLMDHKLPKESKGFFQAYVAHSTTIDQNKKNDYLLYKTIQYALKAYNEILIAPITNDNTTILKSFDKIHNLIIFFKKNSNHYQFTPHIRFNILFYLALLQDMAHNRKCYYTIDQTLCADIYTIIPDPATMPPEKIIDNLDKYFNPLIEKYKDENGISNITIATLKAFYNKTDVIILTISNEDGTIDTNTFLHFLVKKYILVGCGNKPSDAHGKQLTSLTDLILHDILHAYIQLFANKHNIINNQLSDPYNTLRDRFLSIVENIINKTNTCYKNALSENNRKQATLMQQYKLILFIILHEILHSYQFYDPTIQKAYFKDGLNVLFGIDAFKKLKPNDYTNQKITQYFLFNSMDILNAICYFNPKVNQEIDALGLCISPTKIERQNKLIYNKELKKIIETFVINQLCAIFDNFFNDTLYKDILDKTVFPFKT